jgi:hypothetical protein
VDGAQRATESLETRLAAAEEDARTARALYSALARRKSVRAALKLSRLAEPFFRLRRRSPGPPAAPRPAAEPADPARVRARLRAALEQRGAPAATTGPLVSILVSQRGDRDARLPVELPESSYRARELIRVDDPAAMDHAVARAKGELLLFLDRGVEPISSNWLGVMVDALQSDGERVAVGAVLASAPAAGSRPVTVVHRGIELVLAGGAPRARRLTGADPIDSTLAGTFSVEAATGAALLVRRDAFVRAGGFDTAYVDGTGDAASVDLCLRLRAFGTIAVAGDAVLFDRSDDSPPLAHITRARDGQHFAERWGPLVDRSLRCRALGPRQPGSAPTVAFAADDQRHVARDLGAAFEQEGWRSSTPRASRRTC